MLCGNDPAARGRMTAEDLAAVDWYRDWLAWSKLPADERAGTPEPQPPTVETEEQR